MANVFTATPFSPEEVKALARPDPQPTYAELLARCPVHKGPDGTRTLLRMADVAAVSKDPRVLGPGANGPTMGGKRPLLPLDLDGEEHHKFRRLLDPLFSARRIAHLEPQVRELANQLIDGFIGRKEADLQEVFCEALPSIFFLRIMGLPTSDLPQLIAFKNAILGHLPPTLTFPERMAMHRDASARCNQYLAELIARRWQQPAQADDLIGWLIEAEVDGVKLTQEQILDISYLMIIAGLDTTSSSLACMIARLAREPALRKRLVAEPALWPTAIEELLRFESPVPRTFRTPAADVEAGGEQIPARTFFFVSFSAANLDPAAFADPLTIDLARKNNPHVAFGSGFHRCLGIHLARMELRAALEELHRRIPDYALKPGHELVFNGMPRWANGLPLVWD